MIDTFDFIIKRPVLLDQLERHHLILIELIKKEILNIKQIFEENYSYVDAFDEKAPIYYNMPPISGSLQWINSLKLRIEQNFQKLLLLNEQLIQKEEFLEVENLYKQFLKKLQEYKEMRIKEWFREVEDQTQEKLEMFLLSKNAQDGILNVNFDPQLKKLLREVKYFNYLKENIPEKAEEIYKKDDVFRMHINKLDCIVQMYNTIITTLNPIEEPLVEQRIERINKMLEPGIKEIRWNSLKIGEFIQVTHNLIEETFKVVNKMKEDLEKIQKILISMQVPLIQKKNKSLNPGEYFNIHQASINNSFQILKSDSSTITKLIKEINDAVKIDKKSQQWKNYLDYINDIIIDGVVDCIMVSLKTLDEIVQVDRGRDPNTTTVFDIQIELNKNEVQFNPPIEEHPQKQPLTIRSIIMAISFDFVNVGNIIQRQDTGGVGDYLIEIKFNLSIRKIYCSLVRNLNQIEVECEDYKNSFKEFKIFWNSDAEQAFLQFLDTVPEVKEEDEEANNELYMESINPLMKNIKFRIPPPEKFDSKINELKDIRLKIS